MIRRQLVAVVATSLVLCLAACTSDDGTSASGSLVDSSSGSSSGTSSYDEEKAPAALTRGLEPCPESDPSVNARPDGLPDVSLRCLGSTGAETVRLAGLRGLPTVVNVWASWCGPCREELPAFAEVHQAAVESGAPVEFLGILLSDEPTRGASMLDDYGVGYASVEDPEAESRPGLRFTGPPMTLVVDADGQVVAREFGALDEVELRALVAESVGVTIP